VLILLIFSYLSYFLKALFLTLNSHYYSFGNYKQILTEEQIELLPLIKAFKREFYLVGGTAIARHIGHRRSVDFDLFKYAKLRKKERNFNLFV
jgi:hypothetical protein